MCTLSNLSMIYNLQSGLMDEKPETFYVSGLNGLCLVKLDGCPPITVIFIYLFIYFSLSYSRLTISVKS